LEFLGDAVLDLVSSEYLYRCFPSKLEGDLTQIKSVMVSGKVLTREARRLGLGKYLLLSENEDKSGGRNRSSILEDAFEALVGAIYLDGGYRQVRRFLVRELLTHSKDHYQDARHRNYKSLLLEYTQGNGLTNPEYIVREEIGPEHRKKFVVEVVLGEDVRGSGEGRTKKSAEQKAAREAARELSLIS
jgi:ribonuclease-3